MTNSYTRRNWVRGLQKLGLAALLTTGTAVAAQAQALNYTNTGVTNTAGTYTDLGTSGTAIATANTDDANSAAQPIGFSFSYNGANFTQFVFNTNGVIRLGSAAPSTAALYYDNNQAGTATDPLQSNNAADVNLLMPFNIDLVPGSGTGGTDYRVLTSGTAPNRVCTIQWRNVADKAGAGTDAGNVTQFANISFQLKLYETNNTIEFVYGDAIAGNGTATQARFPNVGVKGSGLTANQLVLALKGGSAAWSTTTFRNTNYTNVAHNINSTALPDAGRTYRFAQAPPLANDIAVQAVYTLGKIATPSALPQQVRAFVANVGVAAQTGVVFTMSITGANTLTRTFTADLAVGASAVIPFDLPATLLPGTNVVTVTAVNDENSNNNSATAGQLVTTDRLSYIDPSKALADGINAGAGSVLAVKYTVPNTFILKDAVVGFSSNATNPTTFRVLIYDDATGTGTTPGNLLYISPAQNRPAAGGNVTVALPGFQRSGTFYIGVQQLAATALAVTLQEETPLRGATFYFSGSGTAPWLDLALSTVPSRLAIEVGLAPAPGCATPTALAVTATTPTTATISFADTDNSGSYQVIYGPVGFQPATSGTTVTTTASPFTITGLQGGTTYQVYVRSNCSGGGTSFLTAPVGFGTTCDAVTTVATFPYTEGFDRLSTGLALPCGVTVLSANGDAATWAVSGTNPSSGTRNIRYAGLLLSNVAADDWFFTPALELSASSRYQVAFRYRGEGIANSPSEFTESLEVTSGTAATVAAQTNVLYTNAAITNTSYALANATSTPVVALLPAGAGTQFVGFHVKSLANQGNLYIDNISITATAVTANSEALLRAISVFPNPSTTGLFDLEIHGAKAKGNLSVQVTNVLGQNVYTGSARDNYTNKLDLSRLAPGIYYLNVRNGAEYTTSRISIVK